MSSRCLLGAPTACWLLPAHPAQAVMDGGVVSAWPQQVGPETPEKRRLLKTAQC